MSKIKTHYVCHHCGSTSVKWLGKCPGCQQWNTMIEEHVTTQTSTLSSNSKKPLTIHTLDTITSTSSTKSRLSTQLSEFDRVLGGGLVSGSVILLGGEPGIGKSTLLLQVLAQLHVTTLYMSAEESEEQVLLRAQRLHINNKHLHVLSVNDLTQALHYWDNVQPQVVVVDSLQTFYHPDLESAPGSISQVREVAHRLSQVAKQKNCILFLVGQINKEGMIAGPKVVEHLVDVVLHFECEQQDDLRLLYVHKNRFGASDEVGIFEMTEQGLQSLTNPSQRFLSQHRGKEPGAVVTAQLSGTRPMLVEIQALCVSTPFGMPRRTAIGFDHHRLAMLLAVIERHARISVLGYDVFVNVVGGLKLQEPSFDLAIVLAVISSLREKTISPQLAVCGEVGLTGEIRKVRRLEQRIDEAKRLGFQHMMIPHHSANKNHKNETSGILMVNHIKEAVELAFSLHERK